VAVTFSDLTTMDRRGLHGVMLDGHPLDPEVLAGRMYLGVDLSLPEIGRKLLWHTFRKTFHRDEDSGVLRGWNVRMEQLGIDGPRVPMTLRSGREVTFGHYVVSRAGGVRFPWGWDGSHYLDYGAGRNRRRDLARFGRTPLVAVNAGSQDLLLGWEVVAVGGRLVPLPLYWALRFEGPLDTIVDPPRELTRITALSPRS